MTEPATVSSLIRAALFVRDLGASRAFYGQLGLTEVYFDGPLTHPSALRLIELPETAELHACIVKPPGAPNFGMVGLFHIAGAHAPPPLPPHDGPPRPGEVGVVFYVEDLPAMLDRLLAAGGSRSTGAIDFRLENIAQLEACLRDPDGVLVNLIEAPPARQNRREPDVAKGAAPDGARPVGRG